MKRTGYDSNAAGWGQNNDEDAFALVIVPHYKTGFSLLPGDCYRLAKRVRGDAAILNRIDVAAAA